MRTRTIARLRYLRPLIYVPLVLLALYVTHFATDLFFPFATTDAHRAQAAAYLEANDLPTPPEPFLTDGCTLFPDQLPGHDFRTVCIQHDIAYWAGGDATRQAATNQRFYEDLKTTGPLGGVLAVIMYSGVTYLGDNGVSRILDTHWGYGWD